MNTSTILKGILALAMLALFAAKAVAAGSGGQGQGQGQGQGLVKGLGQGGTPPGLVDSVAPHLGFTGGQGQGGTGASTQSRRNLPPGNRNIIDIEKPAIEIYSGPGAPSQESLTGIAIVPDESASTPPPVTPPAVEKAPTP